MTARRVTLTTLVSLCVLAGGLLLGAVAASASMKRPFLSSFAAALPSGVAVDQETGNVYVAEAEAGVVAAYGPNGGPPVGGVPARTTVFNPVTGAVEVAIDNACYYHQPRLTGSECEAFDPSNGDLYVNSNKTVANPGGAVVKLRLNVLMHEYEVLQEFPVLEPLGVAVDDQGDVYFDGPSEAGITEFSPSGVKIATIEQSAIGKPAYLAVGAPGVVYVSENSSFGSGVAKLEVGPTGEVLQQALLDGEGIAATVETQGQGDVLVDDRSQISEYGPSGALIGAYGSGRLGNQSESVAVDEASQHVYATSRISGSEAIVVFGGLATAPDVATGSASSVTLTSATVTGEVDPEGVAVTSCVFEYGTSTSYSASVACVPSAVGSGSAFVQVTAELPGLQPGTAYHYRLVATNGNFPSELTLGEDRTFTTGAKIESESSSDVASTSATLDAGIDPDGVPVTYYFQYGTSASYGTEVPAAPGTAIGSGGGDVEVAQHVQGLLAGTVYHYRVVAVSELEVKPGVFKQEAQDGPDQTFTTQLAGSVFALPDGRQWEMVSPPDKLGALFYGLDGSEAFPKASIAGDAITYVASSPIEPESEGYSAQDAQVLSSRGPGGWVSRDIGIPQLKGTGVTILKGSPLYRFFSEDLSLAAVQPPGSFDPAVSPEASEQTPFLGTDYLNGNIDEPCLAKAMRCFRPLVTGKLGYANVPTGTAFGDEEEFAGLETGCNVGGATFCGPIFIDATHDMSHVVFESVVPLTPESGRDELYEWTAGKLTPVPLGRQGKGPVGERHGISEDGSRIVTKGGGNGGLLMRDLVKGETIELDKGQGAGTESGGGRFQVASADDSRVFFTDVRRLKPGSKEGDLYECEMVEGPGGKLGCELTDVTPPLGSGEPADVIGTVPGASEDGSYVYFVANGRLTEGEGAVAGSCPREQGNGGQMCNLYVRHDGRTKLIAVLSGADTLDWAGELTDLTARVSPNGQWLAFMSQQDLTGYDTRDALSGRPDEEVYLYDASTERLVCALCDPTGARPVGIEYGKLKDGLAMGSLGSVDLESEQGIAANVPGWDNSGESAAGGALYQSRYLSDSGRLFFDSSDALVPQDVNGTEDVYEYEPPGIGNCTTGSATFGERSGGCVDLLSSGTSGEESAFLDASGTGGDVFFLTAARLAPQDVDAALDVYDAHECTSASPCFPQAAVPPPPCTTGDACKPAPTPQPAIFGAPASATFSGAGNLAPPPPAVVKKVTKKTVKCKKSFTRKKNNCVKAKKSKRAKKASHNRRAK